MMMIEVAQTAQLIACAAMTGIIWMVQIAIYPLFASLKGESFRQYHDRYMHLVSFVIAPLMFTEVAACMGCLILGNWQDHLMPTLLLALVWASTAFIQVPQHKKLTPESVPALVHLNWIRTTAWTTRTLILSLQYVSHP